MYFNENRYKQCIKHLIDLKFFVILLYIALLACIGMGCAYLSIKYTNILDHIKEPWQVYTIMSVCGGVIGLFTGALSTWSIEMMVQEAYWKIDVIHELKNQTTIATTTKNTPFAKTVVAIENKQNPTNTTQVPNIETKEIEQ